MPLTNAVPAANATPPDAATYQSVTQPAGGVDTKEAIVPLPQKICGVTAVGAAGKALIVTATDVLVALTQPVVVFLDSP